MPKNICKILIISLILSIRLSAYTLVQVDSDSDWATGNTVNLSTGHSGSLVLSNGAFESFDDFAQASIRPMWLKYNSAALNQTAGIFQIYDSGNPAGKVAIGSATATLPEEFDFKVLAQPHTTSCKGGIGLDLSGRKVWFAIVGNGFITLEDNYSQVASVSTGLAYAYLRIRKSGLSLLFYYRQNSSAPWNYYSTLSTSATTVSYMIGNDSSGPSLRNCNFDNFELLPLVTSGSWTSAIYDLGSKPSTSGTISWQQSLPADTATTIQTSTSPDGQSWNDWSAAYSNAQGSTITSPPNRYIRVAAILHSDTSKTLSPELQSIRIEYKNANPSKPTLSSSSHASALWSNVGQADMLWSMPVGNPAPESAYKYWAFNGNALVLSGGAAVAANEVGLEHGFGLPLSTEGIYTVNLSVTADASSGGLTNSANSYIFGYDATVPGQTAISSSTHPALIFTNNNTPIFKLKAIDALSGVSGYATVLDKLETGDPGSLVNSGEELRPGRLDNGTYYLHARAIDMAGNTGPVSHYGIRIDYNGALLSLDYVKALPNPVRGNLATLEYELAAPATDVTLEFLNSQGELMKSENGSRIVGKNRYSWDVSGLANGIYLFRVRAHSSEDGKAYSVVRKVAVLR